MTPRPLAFALAIMAPLLLSPAGCKGAKDSSDSPADADTDVDTDADADADADTDADSDADADTDTWDTTPVEINDVLNLPHGRPKNLLVITVDTLRADHVNALGYAGRTTTPNIDRFYDEGVGLTMHRSCSSWTLPSFLCALTGHDQLSLGWWPPNNNNLPPPTPDDLTLMAEYFHDAGYHTMLAGASGFLGSSTNTDQGYDEGTSLFGSEEEQQTGGINAIRIVKDAVDLLEERPPDEPFLMHVHFIDPHMPYVANDEWLEAFDLEGLRPTDFDFSTEATTLQAWIAIIDGAAGDVATEVALDHMLLRYDAEIALADQQIGMLLSNPAFKEVAEETLVVFYSDHGEEFLEHGNFNHGYNSFEEQARVPAALWWPGHLDPATVDVATMHQDLLPTIFAIFGFDDPGFSGTVIGEGNPHEYAYNLVYRLDKTHQAVTDGTYKLMYRWDGDTILGGPKYFYDLVSDPTEQVNLYDPADEDVLALWDLLLPQVDELAKRDDEPTAVPVDPGP